MLEKSRLHTNAFVFRCLSEFGDWLMVGKVLLHDFE